jgi:RsiW-degrading membrane proteinase PrsW (M82 family)
MLPTTLILAIVLTLMFTLFYLGLLWLADRYEKEPLWLLGLACGGGALIAPLLSRACEALLRVPSTLSPVLFDIYLFNSPNYRGAVIDEVAKWLVLASFAWWQRAEFDDMLDGLVYGAAIGAGFALTASLVYFSHLFPIAQAVHLSPGYIGQLFIAGLLQCVFTGAAGAAFGIGLEVLTRHWAWALSAIGGLIVGISTHLGWLAFVVGGNTILSPSLARLVSLALEWGGLLLLVLIVVLAWRRERAVFEWALADEVQQGVVTSEDLQRLRVSPLRLRTDPRSSALVEFAFAKWRLAHGRASPEVVDALRSRVLQLRQSKGDAR